MNWLSRLLFGSDADNLRDLYNERDLMLATKVRLESDLKTINTEIRAAEERKGKAC